MLRMNSESFFQNEKIDDDDDDNDDNDVLWLYTTDSTKGGEVCGSVKRRRGLVVELLIHSIILSCFLCNDILDGS
eukprot:GDKH01002397.1.p1 GENE.GDKH01002397.1~~GDKH01002397.1.p1  ORF type:complete len:75 (-),score=1.95 GDKH01002397.1:192-416(-)